MDGASLRISVIVVSRFRWIFLPRRDKRRRDGGGNWKMRRRERSRRMERSRSDGKDGRRRDRMRVDGRGERGGSGGRGRVVRRRGREARRSGSDIDGWRGDVRLLMLASLWIEARATRNP